MNILKDNLVAKEINLTDVKKLSYVGSNNVFWGLGLTEKNKGKRENRKKSRGAESDQKRI